jgi:MoxR-like ATPase/predicted RNA-binding protein with PUA-like domain
VLRIADRGLQRLTDYKPTKSAGNGRLEDYGLFCEAATRLMGDYDIPPEELDAVLAAAGRVEEHAGPKPETGATGAWLFQANPSIYDIDLALSELDELPWTLRQYKADVKKGDKVYIWRSGPDAGVVGTATVTTDPEVLPGDAADPYALKPESLSKPEPRVMLQIGAVLPEVLRRSDLLEHAVLKDLDVIRFPNATNFRISPEQDDALQALVAGFRIPTLRAEIEDRVFLPRAWLQEALDLLDEKAQIIFYGPPGTGKTFVALALAEEITRDGGDFRIVQFHPSYSYEDFVGGFRPVEDNGAQGVRYQRTNGPLREMAAAAADDPQHPYVLIIDEINRGNIPKIFGELLFLLEYRLKAVRLQYWPEEQFSLPPNLFLIGTMNTADRSIALVDAALRRRFYFFEFTPVEEPVKSVLNKWLDRNNHDDEPARLLALLNAEIADDEVAVGPSYFMTDPENGPDLERIWKRGIMPLLEEYYYGTKWDRERFGLSKLRTRLTGGPYDEPSVDAVEQ